MADIHIVLIMTLVKLFMCGHKQIIYLQNISSQKKSIDTIYYITCWPAILYSWYFQFVNFILCFILIKFM